MEIRQDDFDNALSTAKDEIEEALDIDLDHEDVTHILEILLNNISLQLLPSNPLVDAIAALKARL